MADFIDLGWWLDGRGRRQLLAWNSGTGHLYLGSTAVAKVDTEDELRRRLDGWPDHCLTREGLGWLAQRLEGCR